jgi:hypothetical protein
MLMQNTKFLPILMLALFFPDTANFVIHRMVNTCDQIFGLKQVTQKVTAFDSKLLVNFVDFRKVFYCVHRPPVWKILRRYRIPNKVTGIIQKFYNNSRCAVQTDGQLEEWFKNVTRVRQGCILSLRLFLLFMNWILRQAADDSSCGIQWVDNRQLDFAK